MPGENGKNDAFRFKCAPLHIGVIDVPMQLEAQLLKHLHWFG